MSRPEKSLRSRALEHLSRREMSKLELKRKLAPYAESEDEIDAVLAEFADLNWQSDERYAEAFINSKSRKHGRVRLKQALTQKGVDAATIAEYLPDSETDFAHACEVLRKKFRQPASEAAEKQKQMRFLLYRGFTADVAQKAMRRAWDDNDDDV